MRVEEGLEVEAVLAGAAHHQVAELLQLLRAQLLRLVVMPVRVLLKISKVGYWVIIASRSEDVFFHIQLPWMASYFAAHHTLLYLCVVSLLYCERCVL